MLPPLMYKARVFDVSSQANPAGVGARRLSGSVILALFLAGYLGQQYLPPPKARVIGLDLGTTFCSVGIFQAGSGEVEVIADEQGRLSIPSTVAFTDTAVLVGHEAADVADSHPENTIYDAKRFIGKIFEPEALEQESARYPFKVRRDETTIPIPGLFLTVDGGEIMNFCSIYYVIARVLNISKKEKKQQNFEDN